MPCAITISWANTPKVEKPNTFCPKEVCRSLMKTPIHRLLGRRWENIATASMIFMNWKWWQVPNCARLGTKPCSRQGMASTARRWPPSRWFSPTKVTPRLSRSIRRRIRRMLMCLSTLRHPTLCWTATRWEEVSVLTVPIFSVWIRSTAIFLFILSVPCGVCHKNRLCSRPSG